MKIGIVIPTYNEVVNVPLLLEAIKKEAYQIKDTSFTILIVDDSSPDGTSSAAKAAAKKLDSSNFSIKVLDRKVTSGYGEACIEGMKQLLDQKVDFVLSMDADLSHNPVYKEDSLEHQRLMTL